MEAVAAMHRSLRTRITKTVPLEFEGRRLPLSLPTPALRLPDEADVPRLLLMGDPDFRRSPAPWRYLEQMGAAHRLEADGVWLTVITRKRGPLLTQVKLVVEPATSREPGMEPRMGLTNT